MANQATEGLATEGLATGASGGGASETRPLIENLPAVIEPPRPPAPLEPAQEEEDASYYQTRHRHGGGGLLRLLLPLAALGLVVAVFFFATRGAERASLPMVEGVAVGAGMEVSRPRFMGEAEDGSPFRVAAETARPDGPDPTRVDLLAVDGELTLPGGRVLNAVAAEGVYRPKRAELTLTGGVAAETDDGYRLTSEAMSFDLGARKGWSEAPVRLAGPLGEIVANRMEASVDGDLVARFDGEVRVVIQAMAAPNADAEARREAARAAGVAPEPAEPAPSAPLPSAPAPTEPARAAPAPTAPAE